MAILNSIEATTTFVFKIRCFITKITSLMSSHFDHRSTITIFLSFSLTCFVRTLGHSSKVLPRSSMRMKLASQQAAYEDASREMGTKQADEQCSDCQTFFSRQKSFLHYNRRAKEAPGLRNGRERSRQTQRYRDVFPLPLSSFAHHSDAGCPYQILLALNYH